MAKKGVLKNGKNKKLHSKLIQQKKTKEQKAKALRKQRLKEVFEKSKKDSTP